MSSENVAQEWYLELEDLGRQSHEIFRYLLFLFFSLEDSSEASEFIPKIFCHAS
jgi:hypothetical protein